MKKLSITFVALMGLLALGLGSCADTTLTLSNTDAAAILSSASHSIYGGTSGAPSASAAASRAVGGSFTVDGSNGGTISVTYTLNGLSYVYTATFTGFTTTYNGEVYELSGSMNLTCGYSITLSPFSLSLTMHQTGTITVTKAGASTDVTYALDTVASGSSGSFTFTSSGTINGEAVTNLSGSF